MELKFRAWDKRNERLVTAESNYDRLTIGLDGKQYFDMDGSEFDYDPRFEIMMFTGLKDKNGNEIYEGDILREIQECWNEGSYRDYLVKFGEWHQKDELPSTFIDQSEGGYGYYMEYVGNNEKRAKGWKQGIYPLRLLETVGNKFENKDLIEV